MNATHTTGRILIVEDDESLLRLLERILHNAGFTDLRSLTDPRQTLPVFREWNPDLVLMDLQMPHLDGISVMQQLRGRMASDAFVPILLMTGDAAPDTRDRALAAGASDFLRKPFEATEVVLRIRNLIALRMTQRLLVEAVARSEAQVHAIRLEMIERLTLAAEYRDSEDGRHPVRVGELAGAIAREMGLNAIDAENIRLAAPLHDVGMIGVPDSVVSKQGSLSLEELDQIKAHTSIGACILANSDSPLLQLAEEIALYHHEAWDGSGYTPGLSGASIPVAARIVAVADSYHAMIRERPYQNAHSHEEVLTWIESQSGTRFDPDVVAAFNRTVKTARVSELLKAAGN